MLSRRSCGRLLSLPSQSIRCRSTRSIRLAYFQSSYVKRHRLIFLTAESTEVLQTLQFRSRVSYRLVSASYFSKYASCDCALTAFFLTAVLQACIINFSVAVGIRCVYLLCLRVVKHIVKAKLDKVKSERRKVFLEAYFIQL